ncbi:ubiquitin carboxyl-terminal hydrolase 37-like [Pungitius pungitius]|uniref:ubiquitin carboxyl-terminal hydrolase 37-like n=1 Tax=Pungitius pungitius TaxID=134920 RepID=UPI002E0F95B9
MNSCLQSLLTLKDFVSAIRRQEHLWNLIPEAAVIRAFMDIQRSHLSDNIYQKNKLLIAFKSTICSQEFRDCDQKDSHEFLTCVLEQMICLSPKLRRMAAIQGRTYICPVEDHIVFKMANYRTCKGCGTGSTREERFTNLSLDVVPGDVSVQQMLQDYTREKDVAYKCECGAVTSGLRKSFLTLPRVLFLHLKRFRFTAPSQIEKVHDPVVILRELEVTSKQDWGHYSLVSSINHIGLTAIRGHYICDGVDPDVGEEYQTNSWFSYNDAKVTKTDTHSVCNNRKESCYILSYRRQVRDGHCKHIGTSGDATGSVSSGQNMGPRPVDGCRCSADG